MLRTLVAAALALAPAAAAAQSPPKRFEIENGALVLPAPVIYETGKETLSAEGTAALDHVAGYLAAKDYITLLRVEVHTDSDGDDAANQALSEKRAFAVTKALVAKGVDCKRLIPVGFGETKPVAPNDTPENKAQNRRTVFANAALRGKPIGGMPVDGGGKVAGDPCK
jgi:OOP family OmpA-OmpF porin